MAMTPLGGFEVNVWLRTKASGTIAIGTIATSNTPEITAMVAVTPPGRLDVTMRLKCNGCEERDQRGARCPCGACQAQDASVNGAGRASGGCSAGQGDDLREDSP